MKLEDLKIEKPIYPVGFSYMYQRMPPGKLDAGIKKLEEDAKLRGMEIVDPESIFGVGNFDEMALSAIKLPPFLLRGKVPFANMILEIGTGGTGYILDFDIATSRRSYSHPHTYDNEPRICAEGFGNRVRNMFIHDQVPLIIPLALRVATKGGLPGSHFGLIGIPWCASMGCSRWIGDDIDDPLAITDGDSRLYKSRINYKSPLFLAWAEKNMWGYGDKRCSYCNIEGKEVFYCKKCTEKHIASLKPCVECGESYVCNRHPSSMGMCNTCRVERLKLKIERRINPEV